MIWQWAYFLVSSAELKVAQSHKIYHLIPFSNKWAKLLCQRLWKSWGMWFHSFLVDFFWGWDQIKNTFRDYFAFEKQWLGKMFIYLIWSKMPRNFEAKFENYSHSSVGLVQKDLCTAHCKQTNFFQKLHFWLVGKSTKLYNSFITKDFKIWLSNYVDQCTNTSPIFL